MDILLNIWRTEGFWTVSYYTPASFFLLAEEMQDFIFQSFYSKALEVVDAIVFVIEDKTGAQTG